MILARSLVQITMQERGAVIDWSVLAMEGMA
jgi:hypothetical protein